jgi:isopenicillin-N N-acyltransferase-like protein
VNRLRVLSVAGSPERIGHSHGATFAEEIRSYADDRIELSREGTDLSPSEVVRIAEQMLPAHEAYDADLFAEMVAMASACGISPAEAVIVGGYTDFIDTVRALANGTAIEDTCTAVITPNMPSGGAGFLAQTWDMHASATPHVFMLRITPDDAPRTLVFTTHGTLGQIGMNEAGVAVGINNLTMDDGRLGVTWPFVVRKVLKQTSFDDAVACVLDADLAGGHNFLILDRQGNGASIEATSTSTSVEHLGSTPVIHTNHCIADPTRAHEADRPESLITSSTSRLEHAREWMKPGEQHSSNSLMEMLRDERSICRRPDPVFSYETSGAVIMRPGTDDLWACWGNPADNEFEHFNVESIAQ